MWYVLCEALTKRSESCRLIAYWDPYGKVWTIGWGSTGPGIAQGVVWTQQYANAELITRIMKFGAYVDSVVKVPLTDGQKAALVDFVYNVGEGNFAGSTLLRLLNNGDYAGAANEFPKWDHAGGVVLEGLKTRREEEKKLFMGESAPVVQPAQPQQTIQPQQQTKTIWTLLRSLLDWFRSSRIS